MTLESRLENPSRNLRQFTIVKSIQIQDLENAQYVFGQSILRSGYPLSMVDNKDM